MPVCLVGLGANLGDRNAALDRAVQRLDRHPQIEVVAVSRWHETVPVGGPGSQPAFLNGAVRLDTSLSAEPLLDELLQIEHEMGRRRNERWAARVLDLDLLLFGDQIIDTARLQVPHPSMAFRRFVLEPAVEAAPDMMHPLIGRTVRQLLDHLDRAAPYVAVAGPDCAAKTALVRAISQKTDVRLILDPAGQAALSPIECLQRRSELLAELLDGDDWPSDRTTAVSDFWLDEPPDRWKSRVVGPKLLIVLGPSPNVESFEGPVLRLSEDDIENGAVEAAAAIEAMK